MLIKKVLVLLSLLVMFGSARAGMTSSDSYNDWNIGLFGAFVPRTNMNIYPGVFIGWSSNITMVRTVLSGDIAIIDQILILRRFFYAIEVEIKH